MSNQNLSRRDKDSQFRQVFSGEMQAGFRAKSVTFDKHIIKKVQQSSGLEFIQIGDASYREHSPGEAYVHDPINLIKVEVNVNKQGYVGFSIPEEDLLQNDPSFRMEAIQEISEELAKKFDQQVLTIATLAARPDSTKPVGSSAPSENVITLSSTSDKYLKAIQDICLKLDKNNIAMDDVTVFVNPEFYYNLLRTKDTYNQMLLDTKKVGIESGQLIRCMGLSIVKTNLVPNSNNTENDRYKGDFTKTLGVAFHRSAVGTIMLQNFRIEKYEDISKGTFVYRVKMICGHEALKRSTAFEIKQA